MINLYKEYKKLTFYMGFYRSAEQLYEIKKYKLLEAHQHQNVGMVNTLIIEVNTLAEILNTKMVSRDDIAGTLEYYPKKFK